MLVKKIKLKNEKSKSIPKAFIYAGFKTYF